MLFPFANFLWNQLSLIWCRMISCGCDSWSVVTLGFGQSCRLRMLHFVFLVQIFHFAYDYKCRRLHTGFPSFLVNLLIFRKVRALVGGRLRLLVSGGAPLSEESHLFTNVCFAPIMQGWVLVAVNVLHPVPPLITSSTSYPHSPYCINWNVSLNVWQSKKNKFSSLGLMNGKPAHDNDGKHGWSVIHFNF